MAEPTAEGAGQSVVPAGTQSKLPMMAIIMGVVNTVAIVVVAMLVVKGRQKDAQTPGVDDLVRGELQTQKAEWEASQVNERVFFQFKDFVVNLAGSRGRRVLKASIEFELPNAEAKKEIEAKEPQIRDQIILILSSKTYEEVSTIEGKEALREELKTAVNPTLRDKNKIVNIYFTEFIYN